MSRRGKKFTKIVWEHEGLTVEVPVRLHTRKKDIWRDEEQPEMYFCALHEDSNINIEDTNIDDLRKKVIEALKKWHEITWEIFILVKVTGGSNRHRNSAEEINVTLDWDFYAVGTNPSDKKTHIHIPADNVDKNGKWDGTRYSGDPQPGLPDTGAHKPRYGGNIETSAFVPATAENIAGLKLFRKAMQELLTRMHKQFHPDQILNLLSDPSRLLPAPAEKPKRKRANAGG